jgi:hypothetical protein
MKYPLNWPLQFPRAKYRQGSKFNRHNMERVTRELGLEIERLRGTDAVLTTNLKLRLDGSPILNLPCGDTGAAVYFKLKNREIALACDKWTRVEDNVWAIAKHIESIRGQERWGVGNIEQAFTGYLALPAPTGPESNCWATLQMLDGPRTLERVNANYRALAEKYHPDRGGTDMEMALLNKAREEALASLKGNQ